MTTSTPTRPASVFGIGFGLLLVNIFSYHLVVAADRFTFSWLVDVDLAAEQWTGLVIFALGVPIFALVLIAGAIADRADRRRQLLATQLGGLLTCAALALLTWADAMSVPLAVGGALCFGVCFAFAQPVRSALVPALVPGESLTRAIVMTTIATHIGLVAGPTLAGWMIDLRGVWLAFAVQAGLFAVSSVAVFRLRIPPRPRRVERRSLRSEITEAGRYVMGHRALRPLFGLMAARR